MRRNRCSPDVEGARSSPAILGSLQEAENLTAGEVRNRLRAASLWSVVSVGASAE